MRRTLIVVLLLAALLGAFAAFGAGHWLVGEER
jgi:hypothetical protein